MNAKLLPLIITLSLAAGIALAAPQSSESPAAVTNRGKIGDGGSSGAVITGPALELYHGEVQVLDLANVTRVAVGDGGVLHANVVASNQQVILIGEGAGTTSLRVWTRNGPQFTYEVKVRSFDTAQILRDVQDLLAGEPGISARQVDGHVLVEGDYSLAKTASRIEALVKIYPQIVSTVPVRKEASPMHVERMVYMDVRVVEILKSTLRRLGVNWAAQANGPAVGVNLRTSKNWSLPTNGGFLASHRTSPPCWTSSSKPVRAGRWPSRP